MVRGEVLPGIQGMLTVSQMGRSCAAAHTAGHREDGITLPVAGRRDEAWGPASTCRLTTVELRS